MYGMYYNLDYLIYILPGFLLALYAQSKIRANFDKYSRVTNREGLTGRSVAEAILKNHGIYDVTIDRVRGSLTDHYDPRTKTVNLSDPVYNATSVAALGVAAHECGHAIQHAKSYAPLSIRSALVPIANFGSMLAWPVILIGLLFNTRSSGLIIDIGILLFSAAVLFQLVTLPVEFDASRRALVMLRTQGILADDELRYTRRVLKSAALTYVASAAAAILQLLRIILITNGRRRDD